MYEFVEQNDISCSREYRGPNSRNRARIWFTFKLLKSGKWLMHMHADYIPSQDSEVTDPYWTMVEITKTWMSDMDKLFAPKPNEIAG